jgi:hypothetical protein
MSPTNGGSMNKGTELFTALVAAREADDGSESGDLRGHQDFESLRYVEYFKFSADGKMIYIRRVFENNQELYWKVEADGYPLDEGIPTSKQAYSQVRSGESRSV